MRPRKNVRVRLLGTGHHRGMGWVDGNGELTPAGEAEAERRHFGDDDDAPGDDTFAPHGWAPDPYEGGELR